MYMNRLARVSRGVGSKFGSSRTFSAKTLVVAEHDNNVLSQGSLATITAALQIGGEVTILVPGKDVGAAAKYASTVKGISSVCTLESDSFEKCVLPEGFSTALKEISKDYTHILAPSTNVGKNFIPRTAALMDSSPLSDVISVIDNETFTRPLYAGNAIATVKMTNPVKFLTVRTTAFDKAEADASGAAPVSALAYNDPDSELSTFVSENQLKSERPDLASAPVVIAGGRGMKNKENFALLDQLADKLDGAVGASRAAVDAGYAPNDYQVGQTGKQVAPDLYIAVGISGAIQHLSGMKDSKTIVAINKDKEAPIFQVSDYGLVEDLFNAVPEMTTKL